MHQLPLTTQSWNLNSFFEETIRTSQPAKYLAPWHHDRFGVILLCVAAWPNLWPFSPIAWLGSESCERYNHWSQSTQISRVRFYSSSNVGWLNGLMFPLSCYLSEVLSIPILEDFSRTTFVWPRIHLDTVVWCWCPINKSVKIAIIAVVTIFLSQSSGTTSFLYQRDSTNVPHYK